MSPKKLSKSVKALRDAEKAVDRAKAAHRAEFRKALAKLFSEYGLSLESRFEGGCEIHKVSGEFKVEDLPE